MGFFKSDLSQALILKNYPDSRPLSKTLSPTTSLKNHLLIVYSALILTLMTSVILIKQINQQLQTERLAFQDLEERVNFVVQENTELKSEAQRASELARIKEFSPWEKIE